MARCARRLAHGLVVALLLESVAVAVNQVDAGLNSWTWGLRYQLVTTLAINPAMPATLYAGSRSGTFKSTDGGGHWSASNIGLLPSGIGRDASNPVVFALALDPQTPSTLYAGTESYSGTSVFKSTDVGAHWSESGSIGAIRCLAVDPHAPTTLYAGTINQGIFKSVDGGASWSAISTGFTSPPPIVSALIVDPQTPTTLYAGTGYGVFKSTDGGAHWNASNTGLGFFGGLIVFAPPSPC